MSLLLTGVGSSAISFSPNATAYFNQVVANGGSLTNNEKIYINTFINSLGADFSELDRLWIFGLSNQIAANTSIVNPTSTMVSAVNAPTFTASQGYTGNGVDAYLDTNCNELNDTVKYRRNTASIGVYALNNIGPDISLYYGVSNSSLTYANPNYTAFGYLYTINNGANSGGTPQVTQGLFSSKRTAAAANACYKNAIQITTDVDPSQPLNNLNFFILARNASGAALNFTTQKMAASFIGSGSLNISNFYTAIQALGTSLGWAV